MAEEAIAFRTLAIKTVVVHTVTYFLAGLLAYTVFDYGRWFAEEHVRVYMRQTDDVWVMIGPMLQPVRGVLFALAFFPLRSILFERRRGWLVLWLELVILGVLSTFGPAPGSVEGVIYTIWPLRSHLLGLPEILLQSCLLSIILHYWVTHPGQRWLNWVLGILFFLVFLLPTLGLLTRRQPPSAPVAVRETAASSARLRKPYSLPA